MDNMNPVTTTNSGIVIPHKFNKLPKDRSENNGTGVSYNLLQKQIHQIATAGGSAIDTTSSNENNEDVESNPETLPRKKKKTTAKQQSAVAAPTTTDEEGPTVDEDDKAAMHLLLHFKDANSKDGSSNNNSNPKKRAEENNTTQMMANLSSTSSSSTLFPSMNQLQAQQALFPLNFQQYLANSNVFTMSAAAAAAAAANPHLANLSMLNFPNAFPALTPNATSASLKRKYDEADLSSINAAVVNGGSAYLGGNYQLHKDGSSVSATNIGANTSTTTSTTKKEEINILQFYEPRFFTVYEQYQQYLADNSLAATYSITTNIRDHLLSLCLDHMIAFCCWARENPTTTTWIKTTLDDNNDLRPEVRNGLSMILMYCFAAAQSKLRKDSDMFIALQDTETGLGIVNKTSLKIYNDPYQYFNFIKSCITGLIDAGKIPENERINKPKKSKPQAESKEEIDAFNEMRKVIVDKLSKHEADFIREKISQISNVVRSKRFGTALAIMMTPMDFLPRTLLTVNPSTLHPNPLDHQISMPNPNELCANDLSRIIASQQFGRPQRGASIMSANDDPSEEEGMKRVPSQATIYRANENPFLPPQLRTSVSLEGVKSPYYSGTTPAILRRESDQQSFQSTSMDYDDDNDDNSQERFKAGVALVPVTAPAVYTGNSGNTPKKASQPTLLHPLERDLSTASVPSTVLPPTLPKSPSPTSTTSIIDNQINSLNSYQQRLPTPTPPNANNNEEENPDPSTVSIEQSSLNSLPFSIRRQLPTLFGQQPLQGSLQSILPNAIIHSAKEGTIVYRFDRISNREWKTREMKIFNFEQLLLKKSPTNLTNFYLIDEKKLFKSLEERQKQHITTSLASNSRNNSGSMMMSLINELHERNALITSWGKNDIIHLLDLIDSWLRGGKNISLLEFWLLRHENNEVAEDNLKLKENDQERGKGVICYEVTMQIGFVIRKNEEIGLNEDCWRMMYFTDLLATTTTSNTNSNTSTSFFDLLITFFPQLSCIVSGGKKRKVVLKYYAHPLFSSSSSEDEVASTESDLLYPPTVLEKKECYQTIGLITEPSENIFARFSYDHVFHDLILQVID